MSAKTTFGTGAGFAACVLWVAALCLLLTASGVGAYTRMYRFQYCSAIADDAERLACYDNYAQEIGLPPPDADSLVSATQRHVGDWTIRTEAFSADHSAAIFAFTDGHVTSDAHVGAFGTPTLITRCFERKTELYIGFGTPLPLKTGSMEYSVLYVVNPADTGSAVEKKVLSLKPKETKRKRIQVELSLGDREPVTAMLRPSKEGRALFFPNPVSLIRQMKLSPTMRFVYKKENAPVMELFFSLEGMGEAIAPLRDSCGW
jgi:hypothetical protein